MKEEISINGISIINLIEIYKKCENPWTWVEQKIGRKLEYNEIELIASYLRNSSLNDLYEKGFEVFGNIEQFNYWMSTPSYGLGDIAPYTLINSSEGINQVYEELIRIEFGTLA